MIGAPDGGDGLRRGNIVSVVQLRSLFEPVFLPQLPIGHNSSEPPTHAAPSHGFFRWTDAGFIGILLRKT
jgi:hypothetical protein